MQHQVNYIFHMEGVFKKFEQDDGINPWHISLYLALFRMWNTSKFTETLSIARGEIMKSSKIGSVNTYYKCIKYLHKKKYIKYAPSKSPNVGSKVSLFRFDKQQENACITSDTSGSISGGICGSTTTDTSGEQVVIPYINSIKHIENNNKLYIGEDFKKSKKKFTKPSLDEVKNYFLEKGSETTHAERFFNHFESNGWLVSGKSPMKDWKAAARNWMLNTQRFNKTEKANHLQTQNEKNYDIPL